MPLVKTTVHAVYTEQDIKNLIIADLKKYGNIDVTISDIWPTGHGPNDAHPVLPENHRIEFVDEYTVRIETISPPMTPLPTKR